MEVLIIVIQKKKQFKDSLFPMILEIPRVVPSGVKKMSVCRWYAELLRALII